MTEIALTKGMVAMIDDVDVGLVMAFKWYASKTHSGFYARSDKRTGKMKIVTYMHRLIMAAEDGILVDHRDGNPLNNRRYNLRLATVRQNNFNRRFKAGMSIYQGVVKRGGKWQARISKDGIRYNLGRFKKEKDAAKAYDDQAAIMFGEFAVLNFPVSEEVIPF
jgi:hypothetical protein